MQSITDVAVQGPVFEWSTSADLDRLKVVLHYWFNIAALLEEQARRRGWKSENADTRLVYEHLVDRLTAALPDGSFAERLRATWPGVVVAAAASREIGAPPPPGVSPQQATADGAPQLVLQSAGERDGDTPDGGVSLRSHPTLS